jgi:Zn-dependent protease
VPAYYLLIAPVLLFSIVAHEYAHGYAALKQGDPTASQLGRLTWNPLKHLDPVWSVMVPLVLALAHLPILAAAKPVPVNPRNYRNYRRGDITVSLAGITANCLIALACTFGIALVGLLGRVAPSLDDTLGILQIMLRFGVQLNLLLAAFNLLPVPPLDGSHVLKYLLPPAWAMRYQRIGFLGIIVLLLLVQTPFLSWWLFPADKIAAALDSIVRPLLLPSTTRWNPLLAI